MYPPLQPYRRAFRLKTVIELTGCSRSYLYAEMAKEPPGFPRPSKRGRMSFWDSHAVESWINARLDGVDHQGGTQ